MGGIVRFGSLVSFVLFTSLFFNGQSVFAESRPATYRFGPTWQVGDDGGWDHLTVDAQHRLLYVTRTTHTLVLDATTGTKVADIPGQQRSHDVVIVPELKRGFISDSQANGVFVFNSETHTLLGRVAVEGADPLLYDPFSGKIFVSCGETGALAAFAADVDPTENMTADRLPLGGKTKYLATDGQGRVYVNVTDKNEVAVVDAKTMHVIDRWPTAPGGVPAAMAIETKKRRLFVGCRNPQKLIVMHADDGKVLADLPLDAGVDGMAFDNGYVLASCRGSVTVFYEKADLQYKKVQTIKTDPSSRTMGVDTVFHEVFLPAAEFDASAPANGKALPKPGSFKMQVLRRTPASGTFRKWHFDTDKKGALPKNWIVAQTKPGAILPVWQVVTDPDAPSGSRVLALVETRSEKRTYNLAIATDTQYKDLELSVRLKRHGGVIDQGGGPVWRYKDENNYYVCRFNPLENNFRLYHVLNAKRTQLATADVQTEADGWHEISVRMIGNRITCHLNGLRLLEVKDDTFSDAGNVGLWTKADAASAFDNVTVRALDK